MAVGAYSREEIEAIYRRQFKLVYQICLVLMKNVSDAEDAAQTVFRKVVERSEPFRDPEHERAWLIVTARNECRDQLKHWWRRCREEASALDALTWEQPEDASIWEQVAALPEKHRLVLFLHYYQGYATGEIAQMLGENPSTVRSRLAQARKKLKLRLEAEGYGTT
jgi:RNA polymerase sigma-70 factor (ECF subfamily)